MLGSSYKKDIINIRDEYDEPIISFSQNLNHQYDYIPGVEKEGTSLYTLYPENHVIEIFFTNTHLSFSCKNKGRQEDGLQFVYDSKIKMCENRVIKNNEEKETFLTNLKTQKIHINVSKDQVTLECRDRKEADPQIKDGFQMDHNIIKDRITLRQLSHGNRKNTHVLTPQNETNITHKKKSLLAIDDPEVLGIICLLSKKGIDFSNDDSLSVMHIRQYTPETQIYCATDKYYLNNHFIHGTQEKERDGSKISVASINDQEQEDGFVTRYKPNGKRIEYEYCNGNKITNFTARNQFHFWGSLAVIAGTVLVAFTKCTPQAPERLDTKPAAALKVNPNQHVREN